MIVPVLPTFFAGLASSIAGSRLSVYDLNTIGQNMNGKSTNLKLESHGTGNLGLSKMMAVIEANGSSSLTRG